MTDSSQKKMERDAMSGENRLLTSAGNQQQRIYWF